MIKEIINNYNNLDYIDYKNIINFNKLENRFII